LCPAGVMLQIAAAKPTIHTTAPTFTEPAGRAVRTDRATALTTVVVTILDEKLVSITDHVMKNRISPITGRFAVRGSSAPVSQELMPTSSFVRQEPSCVAAAVISTLPQRTPLLTVSLKFMMLSPSTRTTNRMMHPRSGGMAVDQLLTVS